MFFLLVLGLANYILQEILFIQIVKCIFVTFFLISSIFSLMSAVSVVISPSSFLVFIICTFSLIPRSVGLELYQLCLLIWCEIDFFSISEIHVFWLNPKSPRTGGRRGMWMKCLGNRNSVSHIESLLVLMLCFSQVPCITYIDPSLFTFWPYNGLPCFFIFIGIAEEEYM